MNFKTDGKENLNFTLEIYNAEGKNILNTQIKSNQEFIWTPLKSQTGNFIARIINEKNITVSKSFQIIAF